MRTPARTGTTIAAAATSLALALTLGVGGASADPGDGGGAPTKAQVDRAERDVQAKARTVSAIRSDLGSAQNALDTASIAAAQAAEAYNAAAWDLGLAKKAVAKADRKADRAATAVKRQRKHIARLVVDNFRGGTRMDQLSIMVDAESSSDVLARYGVLHSARSSADADYSDYRASLSRAKVAKVKAKSAKTEAVRLAGVAEEARDQAVAAEQSAGTRVAAMETRTAALTRELAVAQGVSNKLATQRARAIRLTAARAAAAKATREQQARDAAAPADTPSETPSATPSETPGEEPAPAPSETPSPAPSDPDGSSSTTPPSGGASAAIAFAKQQLGDPYAWGATGPSSWDCSGLMLKAWAAGGKSIPRTSRQQYAAGTHISRAQLQPGDMMFWGSSPGGIYHVAMYIGDNQMIHAPRTGRDVEIVSVDYWIPPTYFARP